MNPVTIGMIGKAGSGKDTAADHLVSKYGFVKIAFADPLKRSVQMVFNIDDETMYNREKREEPLAEWPGWSVRKLLQFVGTELFRNNIDEDIWVKNCASRSINNNLSVISDVRFKNEVGNFRTILNAKGRKIKFIKVERPNLVNGAPSGIQNHASEAHVDELEYDYLIVNDGSLSDLYKKIDEIVEKIKSEG